MLLDRCQRGIERSIYKVRLVPSTQIMLGARSEGSARRMDEISSQRCDDRHVSERVTPDISKELKRRVGGRPLFALEHDSYILE